MPENRKPERIGDILRRVVPPQLAAPTLEEVLAMFPNCRLCGREITDPKRAMLLEGQSRAVHVNCGFVYEEPAA